MAPGVETPVTHPDIGVRHFSGSREAGIDHNQWTPTRRGKIIVMTTQGQKDDSPAQDLSETGLLGREGVKTGSVAHHIWAAGIALRAAVKDQTGGLGMVVRATPMGQEAVHPPKIVTRGSVNADVDAEARLSPNFQHSTASLGNGTASFASLDKERNPVAGTPRKSWIDSWPVCGEGSRLCVQQAQGLTVGLLRLERDADTALLHRGATWNCTMPVKLNASRRTRGSRGFC